MPDAASDKPEPAKILPTPPAQKESVCLRCKAPGPVSDDGFCSKCEQLMEQACL